VPNTYVRHPNFVRDAHPVEQGGGDAGDADDGQVAPLDPVDGDEAHDEDVDGAEQGGRSFDGPVVDLVVVAEVVKTK
jgi:hypothetical protein